MRLTGRVSVLKNNDFEFETKKGHRRWPKLLILLVGTRGFEPPTT